MKRMPKPTSIFALVFLVLTLAATPLVGFLMARNQGFFDERPVPVMHEEAPPAADTTAAETS